MKVLIIDNEAELAETLARFLAGLGHDPVTALDVRQAIDSVAQHHPELVITDFHLPDGNGLDVVRHVRQTLPRTPAILMTAYHAPGIEHSSRLAGVAGYLRKPFALAALVKAIELAVKSHLS